MKVNFILSAAILFLFTSNSFSQYSVGVGIMGATSSGFNFTTETEKFAPGAQIKFQYRLDDKFAIAPNIGVYAPSSGKGDLSFSVIEANVDFQINVMDNQYNRGYFILGPSYIRQKFTLPAVVNNNETTVSGNLNRFGGFVGFGVEQTSDFYQELIVRYKSQPEGWQFDEIQIAVRLGYLFNMGKPKITYQKGYVEILEDN